MITTTERTINAALIGRVKNMVGSPWEMISERRRFCSAIGPKISASKNTGACIQYGGTASDDTFGNMHVSS